MIKANELLYIKIEREKEEANQFTMYNLLTYMVGCQRMILMLKQKVCAELSDMTMILGDILKTSLKSNFGIHTCKVARDNFKTKM